MSITNIQKFVSILNTLNHSGISPEMEISAGLTRAKLKFMDLKRQESSEMCHL